MRCWCWRARARRRSAICATTPTNGPAPSPRRSARRSLARRSPPMAISRRADAMFRPAQAIAAGRAAAGRGRGLAAGLRHLAARPRRGAGARGRGRHRGGGPRGAGGPACAAPDGRGLDARGGLAAAGGRRAGRPTAPAAGLTVDGAPVDGAAGARCRQDGAAPLSVGNAGDRAGRAHGHHLRRAGRARAGRRHRLCHRARLLHAGRRAGRARDGGRGHPAGDGADGEALRPAGGAADGGRPACPPGSRSTTRTCCAAATSGRWTGWRPPRAAVPQFRQDRFLAAVDWRSDEPFRLAYIVRAVTPGTLPPRRAASVEDMYRPQIRARRPRRAGDGHRMRPRALLPWRCCCWSLGLARDAFDAWIDRDGAAAARRRHSVEVLARDGTLLRAYTVAEDRWRLGIGPGGVDPRYLDMLVRYEDKRFWRHPGVDPLGAGPRGGAGGAVGPRDLGRLDPDDAGRAPAGGVGRPAAWPGKLRQVRRGAGARAAADQGRRSWRSTSTARRSAAISRGCAPPPTPGSAGRRRG